MYTLHDPQAFLAVSSVLHLHWMATKTVVKHVTFTDPSHCVWNFLWPLVWLNM